MTSRLPTTKAQAIWLLFALLIALSPGRARASTWNPTVLVNTESFQIVDEGDSSTDVELRFGDSLDERLYWDISDGVFRLTDDLYVAGTLSGTSLTVSSLKSCDTIDTDANGNLACGTDSGGAGSGMGYGDIEGIFVNQGGDTMTGALSVQANLSGSSLRVDRNADVFGNLTVSGTTVVDGTTTLNGVTYTWPGSTATQSGHVLKINPTGNTLVWSGGNGMRVEQITFNGILNCGNATVYMGFDASGVNCDATEANVDSTLELDYPITVTGMKCAQLTDSSCTWRTTLRQNAASAGAPDFQCTGSNQTSCVDASGSVSYSDGDEIAILVEDTGANCSASVAYICQVYYSW